MPILRLDACRLVEILETDDITWSWSWAWSWACGPCQGSDVSYVVDEDGSRGHEIRHARLCIRSLRYLDDLGATPRWRREARGRYREDNKMEGMMVAFILVLLLLWIIGGVAGLVLKGLMWLFWVSLVLFVITAVFGFIKGIFTKK